MSSQPAPQEPATRGLARSLSQATLILALLLLAATFFLISPPPGRTYPSAIPWDNSSILHPITELMSFNGTFATIRGVEIKELALHLAAGIGLLLFALRIAMTRVWRMPRGEAGVVYAQLLLAAWVLLELLSVFWSSDPDLTRSQTLIYALALAWAISLAGNLRHRSATHLLAGLITITTLGAILSIWYYYERNPFHRASFPIGNPTSLAAVLLPAIICTLGYLAHTLLEWRRGKNTPNYALLVAAMFALLPLIWCFVLTRGRGATLALAVGLATMLIYTAGRRTRWLLAIGLGLGILLSGFGVYYSSRLDVTMARGAAMRFRLYAWRYATQLWQSRPYGGHGAGSYPRLAGQYSVRDQSLDPGAFMGRIVEHAHNELFEIISEVGITGGIAYVGGFVATFLAAAALLRRSPPGTQRWLVVGLVGSLAALLADSLVGSAQRLPGAPAILFTLLGMLWCVCNRPPATDEPAPAPIAGRRLLPLAAAIVCALAGLTATAVAIRGYRGNLYELRAQTDIQQGALTAALNDSRAAEELSLDPVSKLAMRHTALEVRLALARQAFSNFIEVTAAITTAPASPDQDPRPAAWKNAVRQAQQTYEAALELLRLVPALERTDVMAARVAELLAELHHRAGRDDAARQWSLVAEKAWRRQQQRTPFDVETLLALTSAQYHPSLEAHVALLRDALRFRDEADFADAPQYWQDSLRRAADRPKFTEALEQLLNEVGPMSPQTDVDALVASRAPEMHRLVAAWLALRGEYADAAHQAELAAALYEPLRPRFPRLYPVALAEQAEYLLQADVNNAAECVELLRVAIAALPTIQAEKYEHMLRPYRFRLALALIAAGRSAEVVPLVRAGLGELAARDEMVARTLSFLLSDARSRGVLPERLAQVRSTLCGELPELCEQASEPAPTTQSQ